MPHSIEKLNDEKLALLVNHITGSKDADHNSRAFQHAMADPAFESVTRDIEAMDEAGRSNLIQKIRKRYQRHIDLAEDTEMSALKQGNGLLKDALDRYVLSRMSDDQLTEIGQALVTIRSQKPSPGILRDIRQAAKKGGYLDGLEVILDADAPHQDTFFGSFLSRAQAEIRGVEELVGTEFGQIGTVTSAARLSEVMQRLLNNHLQGGDKKATSVYQRPTKITVLIPNYNYGHFVDDAIESIKKARESTREHIDITVLVGDDKSTDDSIKRIKEAQSRLNSSVLNIQLHEFSENRGPNAVLNDLIRRTPENSDYTVVLDADDKLRPEYFRTLLYAMHKAEKKDPEIAFIYSNCVLVDKEGVAFNKGISRPFDAGAYQDISYIPSTALIKSSVLREAVERKPFDETVRKHTKHPRYKQLINEQGSKGLYIPAALFDYRQHEGNLCEIGKATLAARDDKEKKQHRITKGGYYKEGERRLTFAQYMSSLNAQFGIDRAELASNAGGELEYAERTGVSTHRGRQVERSGSGVNLSAHWAANGATRA